MRKPRTWWVVADGGHARVLEKRSDEAAFDLVQEFESATRPRASHDLGSERPGRTGESASPARHALQPRSDLHEVAKRKFAEELASVLSDGISRRACENLVLVAPARFLHDLRAALRPKAREAVMDELALDLTKVPTPRLGERLLSHGDEEKSSE
jgi:protein required for attachment to host cells